MLLLPLIIIATTIIFNSNSHNLDNQTKISTCEEVTPMMIPDSQRSAFSFSLGLPPEPALLHPRFSKDLGCKGLEFRVSLQVFYRLC